MTDPRFPNDVSVYGVEIKTDIVIKQTVPKTSKTNKGNVGRVQEYKTFYKDGKTSIYPVDSSGQILQGAKPIYENGIWDKNEISEPIDNNRGRQTNVTIDGLQEVEGSVPPVYKGVVNDQLKDATKNHALAINDDVPTFATKSEYATEIEREIARLEAELEQAPTNKKQRLFKKIRALEEKLDSENNLELPTGTTGVLVRGAENYDNEEDRLRAIRNINSKIQDYNDWLKKEKEEKEQRVHYIGYDFKDYGEAPQPPPLPSELISMADGEDRFHYYVDKSNLNGLANVLYKNYNTVPSNTTGTQSTIHRLSYGNLRIYSNKTQPPNPMYLKQGKYDRFYQDFPEAKKDHGILPTETDVAQAIYDKEVGVNLSSTFNSQMRQIFYENEIKPDCRTMKTKDKSDVFSVDIHRAYSTAMKDIEQTYSIFDCVNQPARYNGKFNPNYFYLCYNKDEEFPLRGGMKKLLLYHGCLIQHLLDRVDVRYVLEPIRTLKSDHFKPFVENCSLADHEYSFCKEKILVNVFIGNLKKKDGISDYKLWLMDNQTTIIREVNSGRYASKLVDGNGWSRECCLVGFPKHQEHFDSANPIRLQIMEKINEMNYRIHNHYKACLHSCDFITDRTDKLVGVKTDALYFGDPVKHERVYEFMDYLVDSWNDKNTFKIRKEHYGMRWKNTEEEEELDYLKTKNRQIGVEYVPNAWDTTINIKHKWDKETEGRMYINLLLRNGGGWVSGLGGRGKSELITEFKKMIKHNKKILKRIKILFQYCFTNHHERIERWKMNHPTYVKWLAPTNKACNRLNIDQEEDTKDKAKTINKGLGIPVRKDDEDEDEDEDSIEQQELVKEGQIAKSILESLEGRTKKHQNKFVKRFRTDVIVIDELSMVGSEFLSYLAYIKHRIPTIKFLLMGDLKHQLKPVGEEHRNFINSFVIKELANFNRMILHYNFRTGKATDDLWDRLKTPEQFNNKTGEDTTRNLCFTHHTRKKVIELCQDKLVNPIVVKTKNTKKGHNDTFKYNVGVPVIARKTSKKLDIARNEYFTITEINDGNIKIEDENKTISLTQQELVRYFVSGFCITIHNSQSETYRDKYTIHDWKSLCRKSDDFQRLRYTAFSRSVDWENNVFIRL